MKQILFLSMLLNGLFLSKSNAQYNSNYNKVGRHVGLDFSSGNPIVNMNDNCTSIETHTSTSICNSRNEIIFYSNACRVYNRLDQVMPNGSNFNHGTLSDNYINTDFYPPWKAATIIPFPNDTNKFYMFYENMEWNVDGLYVPEKLYYLVVDKSLNGGLGDVTLKDQVVLSGDTLTDGEVLAVKHGNGKDWWIVCRKFKSDKYYKILVNSSGVQSPLIQHIGISYTFANAINGVCNENPNGEKMVFVYQSASTSPYLPTQIDLFHFDRCSGLFSNYTQLLFPNITDTVVLGICCFSPSGKYLYSHDGHSIWQFDLTVSNIKNSEIYVGKSDSNALLHMQIGPDNKIYVGPYGSANYIGVINHPDSLGAACDFQPYQIYCHGGGNYADGGLPNTPNFALGAVAPCGVGIENIVTTNESLTVCPNPTNSSLKISSRQIIKSITVFDLVGKEIFNEVINKKMETIDLEGHSNGLYFIKIINENGEIITKKIVKE